jgi:hypothetical protein
VNFWTALDRPGFPSWDNEEWTGIFIPEKPNDKALIERGERPRLSASGINIPDDH